VDWYTFVVFYVQRKQNTKVLHNVRKKVGN
jgi:hypothetical protein